MFINWEIGTNALLKRYSRPFLLFMLFRMSKVSLFIIKLTNGTHVQQINMTYLFERDVFEKFSRIINRQNIWIYVSVTFIYALNFVCIAMMRDAWIIRNIARTSTEGNVETRISRSVARNIIGIAARSRSLALRYVDAWYRADRFDGIFDLTIARE